MIGKGTARRGNWLLIGGLAAAGITAWSAVDHFPHGERSRAGQGDVRSAYAKLPLAFEPNLGQAGDDVRYLARVPGATLLIGDREATLRLRPSARRASRAGAQAASRKRQARRIDAPAAHGPEAAVTMRFVGARPKTAPSADRQLPGRVNYLIGQDPSRWTTNIPTFGEVRSAGVYDGVDVAYYGNGRQLEYDLIVQPGADPSVIKVALTGADQLSIDPAGDLLMETAAGVVRQNRPVAYQEVNGTRRPVGVRYALNERVLGFEVEEYDRSLPLLIDPLINYGSYLGGSGDDLGSAVGVDAAGNAYVTGSTESANFPSASGALQGSQDVFVSKLNAAGTALLYSTYVGGGGVDSAQGLAVSSTGVVTVTGDTTSANFPTLGAAQSIYGGAGDAFVFRLNDAGTGVFSTYLGGSDSDLGNGVAVDGDGNSYVAGTTGSANLPGAVNAFGGFSDAFVTKLSSTGAAIVYSRFVGGGDFDAGFGIAIDDASGEAVVVGDTFSTNFPTLGALQNTLRGVGGTDAFVTRLNAAGSALAFSTYFGGDDFDSARAVAVDGVGAVYFTGTTYSDSNTNPADADTPAGERFPIGTAFQPELNGSSDAYVAKLTAAGNSITYSTYVGGGDLETGYAIQVDSSGRAWLSGETFSPDFPTAAAAQAYFGGGAVDAFVTQLHATGQSVVFSSYLGGEGDDVSLGLALNSVDDAYVTGITGSAEFPVTTSAPQTVRSAGTDAFVVKLGTGVGVPLPPTNLRVTATTLSNVALAWDDNSNNETGFELERSAGGAEFLPLASLTGQTYNDTDIEPLGTYVYRVRAVNAAGESPYSNQLFVEVPTTLPAAPTNLFAYTVDANQIDLRWTDNADNEDSYKIERKDGEGEFVLIDLMLENSNAYSDITVESGQTYYYRVFASNAMGDTVSNIFEVGGYSGGKVKVSPLKLKFPKIKAAPLATVKKKRKTITIKNLAKTALQGTVVSPVEPFYVVSGGGPFTIAPKKSRRVVVEFAPEEVDTYLETLFITSTDPAKPLVSVSLQGVGK